MLYVEKAQDNAACRESSAGSRESGSASGIKRDGRGSLASVSEETRRNEWTLFEITATTREIVNASTHDLGW
jgi:hypothetical protein